MRVFARRNTIKISEEREAIANEIRQAVTTRLGELFGLEVVDLQIAKIEYSPTFVASVEAAVKAKNDAVAAENTVNRIRFEAEQVRVRAQGEADAVAIQAEGQKRSAIIRAQGEAEAVRIVGEAGGADRRRGAGDQPASAWRGGRRSSGRRAIGDGGSLERSVAANRTGRTRRRALGQPWSSVTHDQAGRLREQEIAVMLTQSLAGLPAFLSYFAAAIGLLALFLLIYVLMTPYREITLIRQGNTAAAASLSGAILGFVLPLASAIAHSVGLADMAIWGLVALIIQLLVYLAARLLLPDLARDVPAGKVATGVFLGALSLAIGMLNAACMTY